ncbi:MAG TPA: hypothetical protein VGN20_19195 [Mucilaginibacter sp.]|jgi:hypothetical protein
MNTQEAKAIFFAQYYNQKVLYYPEKIGIGDCVIGGIIEMVEYEYFDDAYLLLRSLEQLTDEEKIMFSFMNGDTDDEWEEDQLISIATHHLKDFKRGLDFSINIYQYLLRIGILLPFTYLDTEQKPITLQPNQIIEMGWAKIK